MFELQFICQCRKRRNMACFTQRKKNIRWSNVAFYNLWNVKLTKRRVFNEQDIRCSFYASQVLSSRKINFQPITPIHDLKMVRMLPTRSSSSARLKQFIVDLTILILIGNLERCSSSGNEIRELEKPLFLDKVVEGLKKLKEEWISPPDKGTINFLLFHPSKS